MRCTLLIPCTSKNSILYSKHCFPFQACICTFFKEVWKLEDYLCTEKFEVLDILSLNTIEIIYNYDCYMTNNGEVT